MATHNGTDVVRDHSDNLDDNARLGDHRQRLHGPECPLHQWSDHRMGYCVSEELHYQVLEHLTEYEASRPREQFIAQVRDVTGSYEYYGSVALASDIVLARWNDQGLASYINADRWLHEELTGPGPDGHTTTLPRLSVLYADMDFLQKAMENPLLPSKNPNRSRPLYQFMAQVAVESRSLLDQFRYGGLVRSYDNDDGGPNDLVPHSSTTTIPLEIGIRDLGSLAYKRVQQKWINWRIWDKRWGVMPGYTWKHEQRLGDFLRESMGKERFACLPPNYLEGILRVYSHNPSCPEGQSSAAPRQFVPPPAVVSRSTSNGPSTDAPATHGVTIKAEESAFEYPVSESVGGRSNIENEEPIVGSVEPVIKMEEPDTEMIEPVIKQEESVGHEEAADGQNESGSAGAEPIIKGEEADSEMDQVVVKEEEDDTKPAVLAMPLQTSRPKSNLSAILNDDSSDCPFTNPDYNPGNTQTNCPYTNSIRAAAHGGLGSEPPAAPPAAADDHRPFPRRRAPCRRRNPNKVKKQDSSSTRSITSAAAERAAQLAVPRPHTAVTAAAEANQAWLNQHQTYSSPMFAETQASGWMAPVQNTAAVASAATNQAWPGQSATASMQGGQASGWMGPVQSTSASHPWQGQSAAGSAVLYPATNQYHVPAPVAQGDGQAGGSKSHGARQSKRSRKGKGKQSAE